MSSYILDGVKDGGFRNTQQRYSQELATKIY